MRVFNKIGKATLATTIAAAALLSTSQLSEASEVVKVQPIPKMI